MLTLLEALTNFLRPPMHNNDSSFRIIIYFILWAAALLIFL